MGYRNRTLKSNLILSVPVLSRKTAWENQGLRGGGGVFLNITYFVVLVNITHSVFFLLLSSLVNIICKYHDALNSS